MLSLRDFWRRHRRKFIITAGVLGGGYILYKLNDAHRRLSELDKELTRERENDELIKAQMQVHFENIQKIADTMTLPHAMHYLSDRIKEEMDLSHLTERLIKGKGKGQLSTLTSSEKLELWDRLKILSFSRLVLSLWAMTVLSLYIRVQVNILGRHLYIDTARSCGSSDLPEGVDALDSHDQQKFLACADFLANQGLPHLISDMQTAATEVLKGKQLRDIFNAPALHEMIIQIVDTFMTMGSHYQWVNYLIPDDTRDHNQVAASSDDNTCVFDSTQFDKLMVETRAVLSSAEFGNVVEKSLKNVVGSLMEDIEVQLGGSNLLSGMPLAKLLPRVAQMGPLLLEEPSRERFIQIIARVPDVELFFTLLYASMPTS
ncbi:peroxisome biogenesis protein 3-2-like isoform X1 [Malania oleifera]|uniref:peroxisome biogenesis protein 3-2-like isoform X1 n=1 Tax=Malania oleifera TaxID=397392 RepID=UPI0025ADBF2F|nr:peroxisome biogenesis protein 3-2-like isoform X1 [Malania oleifera]